MREVQHFEGGVEGVSVVQTLIFFGGFRGERREKKRFRKWDGFRREGGMEEEGFLGGWEEGKGVWEEGGEGSRQVVGVGVGVGGGGEE